MKYTEDRTLDTLINELLKEKGMQIKVKGLLCEGRRITWEGRVRKCSSLEKYFTGNDVIVLVEKSNWEKASDHKRRALIDHELTHVVVKNGKIKIVDHDVEEFIPIVRKYGCWTPSLEELKNAIKKE